MVDPIVIMGIPAGRDQDRLIEGFVIQSDTPALPVGYCSLAWFGENFDRVEGSLQFSPAAPSCSASDAKPALVCCKFCHEMVAAATAHLHDGGWVGDACCWDERLRATE